MGGVGGFSFGFLGQVDRCILELQMEAEDMYSRFRNAIENVWLDDTFAIFVSG